MRLVIFPKYQDLFPGKALPNLKSILSGTSSISLLKVASFLNAKAHLFRNALSQQEGVFETWIRIFPESVQTSIWGNYLIFKKEVQRGGDLVTLFNPIALMRLEMEILNSFNDLPDTETKDPAAEMAFLEAWLVMNETFDDEMTARNKQPNALAFVLTNAASQYEFITRKDFVYQLLLANAFFKFLNTESAFQKYFNEFLKFKKVSSPEEYLRHLLSIYAASLTDNLFQFRVHEDTPEVMDFFDSLSIDLSSTPVSFPAGFWSSDPDFKKLRSFPLVKYEANGYFPLDYNFFIDKIYQGLIFDFYQTTSINELYKKFPDFLSALGQEFIETYVFHEYASGCFLPEKNLVLKPGDGVTGLEYSDFYVRISDTVFLFEFKNNLVSAAVKYSNDFQLIKEEILKKMVYNPTIKKQKGVGQLLNVISDVAKGGFPFDDYRKKGFHKLKIYSIIVYTDSFFSLDGVQTIVNEAFQTKLRSTPTRGHIIHEVTLLHLRDVIDLHFLIQSGRITFKGVFEEYFRRKRSLMAKLLRYEPGSLERHRTFRSIANETVPAYADQNALMTRIKNTLGFFIGDDSTD